MWMQHWETAGWLASFWHWRLFPCHKIQLESIVIPFTVCLYNSTRLTFKHLITANSQIKHFISQFGHFSFVMEVNPIPKETQLLQCTYFVHVMAFMSILRSQKFENNPLIHIYLGVKRTDSFWEHLFIYQVGCWPTHESVNKAIGIFNIYLWKPVSPD